MIKSQRGVALPWALFLLALIMIAGAVYIKCMNNEIYSNTALSNKVTLKYITEAGINEGLSAYNDRDESGTFPISGEVSLTDGVYTVEYVEPDTLVSTGIYKNKQMVISIKIDDTGKIVNWQETHR